MCYLLFTNIDDWKMYSLDRSNVALTILIFFLKHINHHGRGNDHLSNENKESKF